MMLGEDSVRRIRASDPGSNWHCPSSLGISDDGVPLKPTLVYSCGYFVFKKRFFICLRVPQTCVHMQYLSDRLATILSCNRSQKQPVYMHTWTLVFFTNKCINAHTYTHTHTYIPPLEDKVGPKLLCRCRQLGLLMAHVTWEHKLAEVVVNHGLFFLQQLHVRQCSK
jgi:hypothetical protein